VISRFFQLSDIDYPDFYEWIQVLGRGNDHQGEREIVRAFLDEILNGNYSEEDHAKLYGEDGLPV
jgi:hypothetical protein